MARPDKSDDDFVKPERIEAKGDLARLCQQLRQSLDLNHAHCPDADRTGLTQQLLLSDSPARKMLGTGFERLVVLDVRRGLNAAGRFDLDLFLQYVARELDAAFALGIDGRHFHPEEISQILKDEHETTLFCFLNIQFCPYDDLQRLRGFTQETHRCLFCGEHAFGKTPAPAEPEDSADLFSLELDLSEAELGGHLLADDEDDGSDIFQLDTGRKRPEDSDIKLVMTTVRAKDEDEPESVEEIELSLDDDFILPQSTEEDWADDQPNRAPDSDISLVMSKVDVMRLLPGADFLASPLFDDSLRKIFTMSHQAALFMRRGQFEEAREWLTVQEQECFDLDEVLRVCLGLQAEVELAQGRDEAALSLLKRQEGLLASQPAPLAACLGKQAGLLKRLGRLSDALDVLAQQESAYRQGGMWPEVVAALGEQMRLHLSAKNTDAALASLTAQEGVSRLHALHEPLVQVLGQRALLLKQTGKLEEALLYFREQQRVAEELGKQQVAATSLGNQAAVYEASGDYSAAETYYQKGEQLCRQLAAHELLARNLANQAFLLNTKLNRPREALPRAEEALRLAQQHKLTALASQIDPIRRAIVARVK